jgi:predicted 3-demethylubiquinone-9 3-methyltransferase (glyoxalase superfamily)
MAVTGVTPFIWYDDDAEEATASYERIFGEVQRHPVHGPDGRVLGVWFTLAGQRMIALQGGPGHPHSDAMSIYVTLDGGQDEVDRIWQGFLDEGGSEVACGWLTDRFGVSWQIVPVELDDAITGSDRAAADYAFQAMMQMTKIVIADLTPVA